jgi:hypothetical protein
MKAMRLENRPHIGLEGNHRRLAKRDPKHRCKQAEKMLPENTAHRFGEIYDLLQPRAMAFIKGTETRGKGVEL